MSTIAGERLSAEGAAFLTWFSRLSIFTRRGIEIRPHDLADGSRIWEALQALSPTHFTGDLPEKGDTSGKWVNNLQNQKRIYKTLRQYILERSRKTELPPAAGSIDVKAVAEGSNDEETAKILKWLFVATTYTEGNEDFMAVMLSMSDEQKQVVMQGVMDFTEETASNDEAGRERPPAMVLIDRELHNEELYGKLAAENTKLERHIQDLQKDVRDLSSRLTRAQEHNGVLLEDLRTAQDHAKQSFSSVSDSLRMKDLEAKLQGAEDHIARQEDQLSDFVELESSLTLEINKLRKAHENLQPLQDSVDELRVERDSLARKNNALERYKQKVQSVQDIETENKSLRRELEESKYLSQEGDDIKQHNLSLQREVSELKTLMSNTEIQLVEAQTRRKQIEWENNGYREQLEALDLQRERDRETIGSLNDQISGRIPDSLGGGLDRELEKSENYLSANSSPINWYARKLTEHASSDNFNASNERLSNSTNQTLAREKSLQKMLDEERAKSDDYKKRYMEAYQARLILEEKSEQKKPSEGSRMPFTSPQLVTDAHGSALFKETTDQLEAIEDETEELKREKAAFRRKFNDAENPRELEPAIKMTGDNADLGLVSAADPDDLEALTMLKELNSIELREQHATISTMEMKIQALTAALDTHRNMLNRALTNQANLTPDPALGQLVTTSGTEIASECKKMMSQWQESKERERQLLKVQQHILTDDYAHTENLGLLSLPTLEEAKIDLKASRKTARAREFVEEGITNEKNVVSSSTPTTPSARKSVIPITTAITQTTVTPISTAYDTSTPQYQEREKQIETLSAQIQQTKEKAAPELLKASTQAALKQENENVKRETKLMATAFFDLSSRLQMNNVSLQRRSEAPRSFLNKQRALVNQATAVRAR